MKRNKTVKHNVVYLVVLFLVTLFRTLPRRAGILIARSLALVFYAFAKKDRKNTIRHLTMAFGDEKSEKEIRRIARQVFLHFATVSVDAMRIPVYIKNGMDQYITTKNLHYLEQVRNSQKGFLLLTGHFGNWELMGAWVAQNKFQLHVVGAAISNPKLNKLLVDMRNQAGYINIERDNATRGIIKAIKDGFPVAFLIDQDTRAKGVFVDFFGIKAHTPIGPAVLARMLDVPIISVAMHLKEDLTYEMECFEPICFVDTGNKVEDITTLTQKCSDLYEQIIRRHPEQWAWMHRRWRKQPDDNLKKSMCLSSSQPAGIQEPASIGFQSH